MKGASSDTTTGETGGLELRRALRQCELDVAGLKRLGPATVSLLRRLDEISVTLTALEEGGMDVRSERTRFEALESLLAGKKPVLLREMRSVGGLASARAGEESSPSEDRWWWYVDVAERGRRRARVRRTAIGLCIGAAVLAIGGFVLNKVFPQDPVLTAKYERTATGERFLDAGEIDAAISEYEAAAELDPSDAEVLVKLGLLYELQGRRPESTEALEKAEDLMGDRLTFLVTRGMWYARLNDAEAALADGNEAVSVSPDSAEAHMVLARAYEMMGDRGNTLAELDATARLAEAAGNYSLYVIAKTNQAMLMQQVQMGPSVTATPME